MTIKQQGGIFGRNPTFNDVEVTDLTVDNDASVSGELKVTGDAGFGTTSPSKPVHVYSTGNLDHVLIDGPVASRSLGWATNGSARWNLYATSTAESGSNAGSDLRLATYNDAGGYNGRVMDFYRDTKDVMITSGNLIINTSGKGIDFSATSGTGTSELFSDYEEGTWTPTYLASTTNPTFSSYVFQTGYYTKIGQMVYVSARMRTNGYNSDGAGNLRIGGLPFTSATVATIGSGGSVNIAGSYLFSTAPVAGYFVTGGSYIQLNSNLSFTASTVSALSTATSANDISFFGVYRAS